MSNVPKLRFKEFSGEWEEKSLGSISKQISYGLTVRPEYIETGIPLISARELRNGKIDYDIASKISEDSYNDLSEKAKAKKGDIFLTKTGTVGLSAYVNEDFPIAITQNIAVIRVSNENYNHQFILQTFKTPTFYRTAISKVNQSTIMDLQLQDIRKLLVFFPSKQEQEKIASFLISVDTKIEQLTKKEALLSSYKKGVMQKIFSGEIRFKADDGSEFCEWEVKKITSIANTSIGLVTTMTKHYVENGVPLIRNSDIKVNKISKKNMIFLSHQFDEENKNRRLLKNDIVTVHTGEIGISSVISEEFNGAQGFATLNTRIKDLTKVLPAYLCWYYNSEKNTKYALSMATGDGRSNYNLKDFNNAKIPLPCLSEQTKIANFLSSIDSKIEQVQKQLDSTKEFKKALLQQMFV